MTIRDHLRYPTVHKHMDHEQIQKLGKNYKKNNIQKYLHEWIKFAQMKENSISPLIDLQLKSTAYQTLKMVKNLLLPVK